jgi:hypothetical protein
MCKAIGSACINFFFSGLYASDLWLDADVAIALGEAGLQALRCYHQAATACFEQRLGWYPLNPRLHSLDHQMRDMVLQAKTHNYAYNPLGDSVQMDEDHVGKISRLSRKADTRSMSMRTLQRYLVATKMVWELLTT